MLYMYKLHHYCMTCILVNAIIPGHIILLRRPSSNVHDNTERKDFVSYKNDLCTGACADSTILEHHLSIQINFNFHFAKIKVKWYDGCRK